MRLLKPQKTMDFRTELQIAASSFEIDYSSRGLMLGSCFVENIGAKMAAIKLPVEVNPLGIIYNPASIAATIERLSLRKLVGEDELFFDGQLWRHYDFHSRFCAADKAAALELMNSAIESGHRAIVESSYVILTLGTARIYRLKSSGKVVCNCHKTPQKDFLTERLSVEETVALIGSVIERYLPNKHIIVTVSPIRHLKDGFEENSRSKATLLLAAEQICSRPNASYFPAYEAVMDDLRDYRFYATDMAHPSEQAVDYIWNKFSKAMLSDQALQTAAQVSKVAQALAHRPFNPETAAHKAFVERTRAQAEQLTAQFPYMVFE